MMLNLIGRQCYGRQIVRVDAKRALVGVSAPLLPNSSV